MLMTFAFSLASVFVLNGSLKHSDEVFVNLPKTESGEILVVFPRCVYEMPSGGAAGGGSFETKVFVPERITECYENR
jgi:hypothetical protein